MSGAQILFLPGAAGAGAFWTPIVERLPKACRAEALDLPGLGRFRRAPTSPVTTTSWDTSPQNRRPDHAGRAINGRLHCDRTCVAVSTRRHRSVLAAATGGVDMPMHGAAEWRDDYRQAFPHAEAWALAPVPDLTARLSDINIPVVFSGPPRMLSVR